MTTPGPAEPARRVIGLAGWSGAGKTTLAVGLIAWWRAAGLEVASVKHAHHGFEVDQPDKDSFRHRAAGAREVLVASATRWALIREHRGEPEPDLPALLAKLSPCDLVLVEGFKRGAHPKIEVWRPETGKPLLAPGDPAIVAIACPAAAILPQPTELPRLDLDDVGAVARFALAHLGLAAG